MLVSCYYISETCNKLQLCYPNQHRPIGPIFTVTLECYLERLGLFSAHTCVCMFACMYILVCIYSLGM